MNLILLTNEDIIEGNRYRLKDNRAEHIINILKSSNGDRIEVGLVNGPVGVGTIENIGKTEILLSIDNLKPLEEIKPDITLICALPRPQTVKKILLISGMTGVRDIHFIRANRVEKSFYHSPLLDEENLRPYLLEGLSQGKHTRLPEVTIHKRFKPFFEDIFPGLSDENMIKLLPDMSAENFLNAEYIGENNPLAIAIGPEGGWVPFEIELMQKFGFKPVKLSQSVLRVEHALSAVLAQIELIRNISI